jgi:hypothetical protein
MTTGRQPPSNYFAGPFVISSDIAHVGRCPHLLLTLDEGEQKENRWQSAAAKMLKRSRTPLSNDGIKLKLNLFSRSTRITGRPPGYVLLGQADP